MVEEIGRNGNLSVIDIDDLRLNKENFRIHFKTARDEAGVVRRLFQEEDIVGMASDIISYGGLYPHENLLAVKESEKIIVLEGNRRTLAIKCLLNQSLVPDEYKQEFRENTGELTEALKNSIRKVSVAFVPSRQAALRIIADKHSDISFMKWGQVSQWNFVKSVYDTQEKDVNKTVIFLGTERSTVVNYCKYYNLLEYIRGLGFWDDEGLRNEIEKNRLEPTRMTRALGYIDIVNSLGLVFDDHFEVGHSSEFTKEKFDFVIFRFAKSSLTTSGSEYIDTRTDKEDILGFINGWKSEYDSSHPQLSLQKINIKSDPPSTTDGSQGIGQTQPVQPNTTTSGGRRHQQGRRIGTEKYLKTLWHYNNLSDDRIIKITKELSTINYTKNPIASLMLMRSLLELTLLYQIRLKNKERDLRNGCRHEPTLDDIVKYTISNKSTLFSDVSLADPLKYVQQSGGHRKFLNDVVHDSWVDPQTAHAELIAGDLRNFFITILSGDT